MTGPAPTHPAPDDLDPIDAAPTHPAPDDPAPGWTADLLAAALVGTARAPRVEVELAGVRPRARADAEVALLDTAALAAALRAAAPALPPADPGEVPACPPDTRPAAPHRAVAVLELLLTQAPAGRELADGALRHWCERADAAGVRCPHRLLPTLLDTATRREEVRTAVGTVLDARGRWLAGVRPAWGWATRAVVEAGDGPGPDDAAWTRSTSAEQLDLLRRLRATRPDRGRELVAATLPTAPARHRVDLLQGLGTGLSDADEPLLEAALDDRAGTVRDAAAALLDRLPGSRRADRCARRLAHLLSVEGLLRRRLRIGPLPERDAELVRDGIGAAGAVRGVPPRVQLLTDLVAAAPAEAVLVATGTDPARLLDLDSERELRPGLVRAAMTRRDLTWARALLDQVWQPELAALLPPEEHRALVARRLPQLPDGSLAPLLHHVPGPWDPALSGAVAHRVAGMVAPGAHQVLPQAGVLARLDPATGPVLQAALEVARAAAEAAAAEVPGPGADRRVVQTVATRAAQARANLSVLRDTVALLSLLATIDEAFR